MTKYNSMTLFTFLWTVSVLPVAFGRSPLFLKRSVTTTTTKHLPHNNNAHSSFRSSRTTTPLTSIMTSLTGGSSSSSSPSSRQEAGEEDIPKGVEEIMMDETTKEEIAKVSDLIPDNFAASESVIETQPEEEKEPTTPTTTTAVHDGNDDQNDTFYDAQEEIENVESTDIETSKSPDETSTTTTAAAADVDDVDATTTSVEDDDSRKPLTRKEKRRRQKEKKKQEHDAAKYAKKLKNRNNMNIRRKITHANFGLFFAALNHFIPRKYFVTGMTWLTISTLGMELLRYKKGFEWMNNCLHFVLGSSLRKHEMEGKFTGSFYYFLGVTVTAHLFPTTAATMGICQLALADPSASYFGRKTRHVYWSRIENGLGGFGRNKGLLGFLGGALFCFPFNYRVLSIAKFAGNQIPGGNKALVMVSLALGFAGAFADLAVPTPALHLPEKIYGIPVPPFHVDDNVVVPIVSGYACTKIFNLMGWSQELQLAKFILF